MPKRPQKRRAPVRASATAAVLPRAETNRRWRAFQAELRRAIDAAKTVDTPVGTARLIALRHAQVRGRLRAAIAGDSDVRGTAVAPATEPATSTFVVTFFVSPPRTGSWLVSRSFAALVD